MRRKIMNLKSFTSLLTFFDFLYIFIKDMIPNEIEVLPNQESFLNNTYEVR